MRRLMCKTKVYIIAIIVLAFVFTLVLFFPAAGAEPEDDSIEIKSSEAWVLETTTTGTIDSARMITWFDMKGDGTTDVTKDNTLEEDTKWQGVHGFTTPVVEDDYLVWKNVKVDSNANVLSATEIEDEDLIEDVSMRIPLDLHYEYWFDEEGDNKDIMMKVSPEDIVGKNGHFRLDLTMTNTSDEMTAVEYEDPDTGEMIEGEVETYLPLVILPYDWYFPNDVFFDLKVDPTGVVVYVPEHYQLGWSIPLFPPATERSHTIWVEADVKNFEMPTLVLSANFIFPETNQIDTMPLFVSGFEQLYDGVKQLHEGLVEGVEGIGDASTEDTLLYGTNAVLDGLKQMAAGLPEAVENINGQMIPGVDEAVAGIGSPGAPDTLRYAIDQSALGMMEMVAGIGGPNVDGSALFGLSAMQMGLEEMVAGIGSSTTPDTLLYGVSAATEGLEEMKTGLGGTYMEDTLLFGMDQLKKGLLEMRAGIKSPVGDPDLLYAIAEVQGGLQQLKDGISSPVGDPDLLYAIEQVELGLNQMLEGIGDATTPDTALFGMDQIIYGLDQIRMGCTPLDFACRIAMHTIGAIHDEVVANMPAGPAKDRILDYIDNSEAGAMALMQQVQEGIIGIWQGVGDSPDRPDTLLYGATQIKAGMEEMAVGIGSADTDPSLLFAMNEMKNALVNELLPGIDLLLYGCSEIANGLNLMLDGIGSINTNPSLLYGVQQVELGLQEMKAGIGGANTEDTLIYAMSAMDSGLKEMKEGIGSAYTDDTLLYAIAQVSNGLELMKEGIGVEGAPDTLLYAMAQVQHGLVLMQAGMSTGDLNNPGLKEGLILVSAGLSEAVAGLGSAGTSDTLIYGADQVNSGVEQVKEGLVQATDEGTSVMQQALMDNLGMMYLTGAQLEAIKVRGEEFDHIMGRTDDANNVVTFIYQTPPTYGYKDGSSWKVAGILSLLILLVLVLGGILLARRPVAG